MSKKLVTEIFELAGITIQGLKPYDIQVHDDRFYHAALRGSLSFGEAYMAGWWSSRALDVTIAKILSARLEQKVRKSHLLLWKTLRARLINEQSIRRSQIVGKTHYDIGNSLYECMLDKRLTYTCGYWKSAKTLDKAQEAKLDLLCKKLKLQKGMRVLDIGCGWGSFAIYAAEKYGVKVVGITISKEQASFARKRAKNLPVEIRLQDYRLIDEKFDRIVSVGMFEHVGFKNYKTYMKVANRCLKNDGIFVLHTIGNYSVSSKTEPWLEKYIFPNSKIPSVMDIAKSTKDLFVIEDWHNFGLDYDKTLMAWNNNFQKCWPKLKKKYSEKFKRMWEFYLLGCAAGFRVRRNYLWQIVLTKPVRCKPYNRVS